jgi:hypothetical protein
MRTNRMCSPVLPRGPSSKRAEALTPGSRDLTSSTASQQPSAQLSYNDGVQVGMHLSSSVNASECESEVSGLHTEASSGLGGDVHVHVHVHAGGPHESRSSTSMRQSDMNVSMSALSHPRSGYSAASAQTWRESLQGTLADLLECDKERVQVPACLCIYAYVRIRGEDAGAMRRRLCNCMFGAWGLCAIVCWRI